MREEKGEKEEKGEGAGGERRQRWQKEGNKKEEGERERGPGEAGGGGGGGRKGKERGRERKRGEWRTYWLFAASVEPYPLFQRSLDCIYFVFTTGESFALTLSFVMELDLQLYSCFCPGMSQDMNTNTSAACSKR